MIGGVTYDGGPMPPGPPLGGRDGGGAPNGGAATLQAKMNRQRQLALERQRISARKQLGAGVIASANPVLQTSPFRGRDWDPVLPDGLGLSPSVKKETRSNGDHLTAPNSPQEADSLPERNELPTVSKSGQKADLDDALDGLAEELLLDDRLPASPQKKPAEVRGLGGSTPSRPPGSQSVAGSKPGASAWGGDAPHKARASLHSGGGNLKEIDEDTVLEASMEPASLRNGDFAGRFGKRKQQTLVLDEEVPEAAPARAPVRVTTPPAQPGRSWDLNVEASQAMDAKTEPSSRDRRGKADGRSWWPFGGGGPSQQPEAREEVTAISSFTFD